jgi:dolichol-phosphate mannosyltransferase
VIPDLVQRWREGFEVVYAVRRKRKESAFKRIAYLAFYRLLQRIADTDIPLDSGDFSLMDRRVVEMLVQLPERSRFVRGLRAWVGFRQTSYEYDRGARFAGEPKYSFRKLLRLALDGILAFSEVPLRFASLAGLVVTGGAAALAAWTLIKRLIGYEVVPGFATITILVLFFGGVQLVTIGILGEYIARIYTEVKGRPRYVIREVYGLEPDAGGTRGVGSTGTGRTLSRSHE